MQPETPVHACAPQGAQPPGPLRRRRTYLAAALVLALVAAVSLLAHSCASLESRRARNRELVREVAADMGVSPALALAVAEVESGFDDRAVSNRGAVGLLQVMPATGKEVAEDLRMRLWDLRNPRDNARIGLSHLRQLMGRYRGDLHLALAAYNAGPLNVARWRKKAGRGHPGKIVIRRFAFKTTRRYVARVLAAEARYRKQGAPGGAGGRRTRGRSP